jgi:hypothetical protein
MSNTNINKLFELGTKYGTDKVYHHEYHDIYDFFLKQFYIASGAMLEIGVDRGNSLNMWLELFTNAHIFGMDIDKESSGERYSIIKGDQSKSDDLQNLCNEAAIQAARENKIHVTSVDFESASERVVAGL